MMNPMGRVRRGVRGWGWGDMAGQVEWTALSPDYPLSLERQRELMHEALEQERNSVITPAKAEHRSKHTSCSSHLSLCHTDGKVFKKKRKKRKKV